VTNTTSLIAYRRSWKRTFAFSLFTAAFALFLAVYLWPLYGNGLYSDGIRPKVFFVGMCLVLGINLVMSLWIAITVASIRRDVSVTLDTKALTCSIPGELISKSFSVPLEDITEINKIDSDSGPEAFRIHTPSGTFNLYGNYGIPTRRIVNEIAKLRPSVIMGTT
jgi:hypothetical protein